MNGLGQTQNLIDNLPNERCAVIVPNSNIGRAIKNRIEEERGKDFVKNIKIVIISEESDVIKLAGYSHLVFFDNSFLNHASEELAKMAYQYAHSCATVKHYGSSR